MAPKPSSRRELLKGGALAVGTVAVHPLLAALAEAVEAIAVGLPEEM